MPRPAALIAILLAALALGACGKDGGPGGSAAATATSTAATATTTAPATRTATTPAGARTAAAGCRSVAAPRPRAEGRRPRPRLRLDRGKDYTAVVQTTCGTLRIRLDVRNSPRTAASFVALARDGFYDQLTFHRLAKPGGSDFV
ncbi:MAG: hypothetical protein QOD83_1330, partial [Solirubrobacteraceae bacterium]|nr:hypothetical protein [Solirubrobacteraceae bacterium]